LRAKTTIKAEKIREKIKVIKKKCKIIGGANKCILPIAAIDLKN